MNMNKRSGGLLVGMMAFVLAAPAWAQSQTQDGIITPAPGTSSDSSTKLGVGAVDASKLVGEDVYDAADKTVGEIESVIVDTKGKVTSVVLDVSGWLESEKRISVPWSDLKADANGKIRTSLSKEEAAAAAGYTYADDVNRGKVLNESGQVYGVNGKQQPNTAEAASDANAGASPALNHDGSFNASKVVGLAVVNKANDKVGKIGEVLLDASGRVAGVVVDVGGFLGIGSHPVKLAWKQLRLVETDGSLQAVVAIDKDALKQMPEYKPTNG
jgi:sporulation protein YlmC with PRC-barrel domain